MTSPLPADKIRRESTFATDRLPCTVRKIFPTSEVESQSFAGGLSHRESGSFCFPIGEKNAFRPYFPIMYSSDQEPQFTGPQVTGPQFTVDVGYATDVGQLRNRNEDSYAVYLPKENEPDLYPLHAMLLVADGMGGERAGDRASQMAAEGLHQFIANGLYRSWPEFQNEDWPQAVTERAIREVNNEIFRMGEDDPGLQGLGSTVVLALLQGSQMFIAHVGDSRCYRVRNDAIEQLTVDHTWVERQVIAGILSREQALTHPQRNVLVRSLGDAIPPSGDVQEHRVVDGDLYILCSDGLTGGLNASDLLDLSRRISQPQALADQMVELANLKDGSDNITAVVGRCLAIPATGR